VLRRLAVLALPAALALAPAAGAATTTDVLEVLGSRVDRAAERSGLDVLVPGRIRTEFGRVFPGVRARDGEYALDLGAAPRCRAATACFVASFTGSRRGRVSGSRRVRLARGRTGRFTPTSCGASCAAPQVQWRERGARYTIQARIAGPRSERRRLVALANAAIRGGPR
jgi:hypothetical protein